MNVLVPVDVAALPARVAHATHALLVASVELRMPCTAAEVCVYDANWEALSGRHTGAALREARRRGLAARYGGYWIPTNEALAQRPAFERRFLADEDAA